MLKIDVETDMCRWPFRGILSEIAEEEGVSRQAIHKRYREGNPTTVRKVEARIQDRLNTYARGTYAAAA